MNGPIRPNSFQGRAILRIVCGEAIVEGVPLIFKRDSIVAKRCLNALRLGETSLELGDRSQRNRYSRLKDNYECIADAPLEYMMGFIAWRNRPFVYSGTTRVEDAVERHPAEESLWLSDAEVMVNVFFVLGFDFLVFIALAL